MATKHNKTRVANSALPLTLENQYPVLVGALGLFEPGFVLVRDQPETQAWDEMKVHHKNTG